MGILVITMYRSNPLYLLPANIVHNVGCILKNLRKWGFIKEFSHSTASLSASFIHPSPQKQSEILHWKTPQINSIIPRKTVLGSVSLLLIGLEVMSQSQINYYKQSLINECHNLSHQVLLQAVYPMNFHPKFKLGSSYLTSYLFIIRSSFLQFVSSLSSHLSSHYSTTSSCWDSIAPCPNRSLFGIGNSMPLSNGF